MERIRYLIGLVTLTVVAFAGWYLYSLLSQGEAVDRFEIRVEFADARGLEPGADVRLRGVPVGTVRDVRVSEDGRRAVAELHLEPMAQQAARFNTWFWVVTPRFSGITSGATGLDTLVRDAYVAFVTPREESPALQNGGLIVGHETPPRSVLESTLAPQAHGDLAMTVLAPMNHGLSPGSDVMFRGMSVGEVRSVQLGPQGTHVVVAIRIAKPHRNTVTEFTKFWIARPRFNASLAGVSVEDMGSLLTHSVGYWTPADLGVPVVNGVVFAATGDKPTFQVPEVPGDAVSQAKSGASADADLRGESPVCLVHVNYSAVEEDWFSPDDHIRRDGTGILTLDADGRPIVIVPRSLCDATWFMSDLFGADADVKRETISVIVAGGTVFRAGRQWVAENGDDLAVLVPEGLPPDIPTTPASALRFGMPDIFEKTEVWGTDSRGVETQFDLDVPTMNRGAPVLGKARGVAVVTNGQAFGLVSQKLPSTQNTSAIISLDLLPVTLRPKD